MKALVLGLAAAGIIGTLVVLALPQKQEQGVPEVLAISREMVDAGRDAVEAMGGHFEEEFTEDAQGEAVLRAFKGMLEAQAPFKARLVAAMRRLSTLECGELAMALDAMGRYERQEVLSAMAECSGEQIASFARALPGTLALNREEVLQLSYAAAMAPEIDGGVLLKLLEIEQFRDVQIQANVVVAVAQMKDRAGAFRVLGELLERGCLTEDARRVLQEVWGSVPDAERRSVVQASGCSPDVQRLILMELE